MNPFQRREPWAPVFTFPVPSASTVDAREPIVIPAAITGGAAVVIDPQ